MSTPRIVAEGNDFRIVRIDYPGYATSMGMHWPPPRFVAEVAGAPDAMGVHRWEQLEELSEGFLTWVAKELDK